MSGLWLNLSWLNLYLKNEFKLNYLKSQKSNQIEMDKKIFLKITDIKVNSLLLLIILLTMALIEPADPTSMLNVCFSI